MRYIAAMNTTRLAAFFLMLSLLTLSVAVSAEAVKTSNGQVSGVGGVVQAFKGIPYAAPPVGDLRWKEPQPAANWAGVKAATEFSAECMQTPYAENSPYFTAPRPVSEDCLYLNVWTEAKPSEKRPVMVWIHGGAFTRGAGSTPTYNGENLARKGVVVVTINYRLGIFGFLAHPELTKESPHHASGNYAILDQIAALQWVQRNIAAFGGDPKRVTIFGESAGSWAMNLLMATPLAKGLFHRVIGESGAQFGRSLTLSAAETTGARLGDLATLRAKSAEDLQKIGGGIAAANVDGYVLPDTVAHIFAAGRQNDVPLMAGYNQDEATAFLPTPTTAQGLKDLAKTRYPRAAEDFLKVYPADSDEQANDSMRRSWRDQVFGWEMRTWVRQQTKTGKSPAYLYFFTRIPPGPTAARLGAYHASEIAYAFGNLNPPRPWTDTDRQLSEAMSSYWVNFATSGDPNGKGVVAWPKYTANDDASLILGDKIEVKKEVNKLGLDFLDKALTPAPTTGDR